MRSSGTDILYGCHLLRCLYDILYFLWPYNEFFIIPYSILKYCWARQLSNYNIKYTCTIYTRLCICLMSISRFSLIDKVSLRLLKLRFYGTNLIEWSRALNIRLSDCCCSVSMVWDQISSTKNNIWHLKNLILTLFGLIFRRIIWYLVIT